MDCWSKLTSGKKLVKDEPWAVRRGKPDGGRDEAA